MISERIAAGGRGRIPSAGRIYEAGPAGAEEAVRDNLGKETALPSQEQIEISEEGRRSIQEKEETRAEEAAKEETASKPQDAGQGDSERRSGKVAVNEGKRARQIAAASTPEQVQMVIELLNKDLSDCEAGLDQGMCDENEVAKVKSLLQKARQRLNEVSGQEEQEEGQGIDAFAIASLM